MVRTELDGALETESCNHPDLQVLSPLIEHVISSNQIISPDLRALVQLDFQTQHRHMQISYQAALRAWCLERPIKTWTDTMGKHLGQLNPTLERCRLRRLADQKIDLDDEGRVNQKRMDCEKEIIRAAKSKERDECLQLIQACDACRKMNVHCERGSYRDCDSCTEAGSPCGTSLARLNILRQDYLMPTTEFTNQPPIDNDARGIHALQDYQRQMTLLNLSFLAMGHHRS